MAWYPRGGSSDRKPSGGGGSSGGGGTSTVPKFVQESRTEAGYSAVPEPEKPKTTKEISLAITKQAYEKFGKIDDTALKWIESQEKSAGISPGTQATSYYATPSGAKTTFTGTPPSGYSEITKEQYESPTPITPVQFSPKAYEVAKGALQPKTIPKQEATSKDISKIYRIKEQGTKEFFDVGITKPMTTAGVGGGGIAAQANAQPTQNAIAKQFYQQGILQPYGESNVAYMGMTPTPTGAKALGRVDVLKMTSPVIYQGISGSGQLINLGVQSKGWYSNIESKIKNAKVMPIWTPFATGTFKPSTQPRLGTIEEYFSKSAKTYELLGEKIESFKISKFIDKQQQKINLRLFRNPEFTKEVGSNIRGMISSGKYEETTYKPKSLIMQELKGGVNILSASSRIVSGFHKDISQRPLANVVTYGAGFIAGAPLAKLSATKFGADLVWATDKILLGLWGKSIITRISAAPTKQAKYDIAASDASRFLALSSGLKSGAKAFATERVILKSDTYQPDLWQKEVTKTPVGSKSVSRVNEDLVVEYPRVKSVIGEFKGGEPITVTKGFAEKMYEKSNIFQVSVGKKSYTYVQSPKSQSVMERLKDNLVKTTYYKEAIKPQFKEVINIDTPKIFKELGIDYTPISKVKYSFKDFLKQPKIKTAKDLINNLKHGIEKQTIKSPSYPPLRYKNMKATLDINKPVKLDESSVSIKEGGAYHKFLTKVKYGFESKYDVFRSKLSPFKKEILDIRGKLKGVTSQLDIAKSAKTIYESRVPSYDPITRKISKGGKVKIEEKPASIEHVFYSPRYKPNKAIYKKLPELTTGKYEEIIPYRIFKQRPELFTARKIKGRYKGFIYYGKEISFPNFETLARARGKLGRTIYRNTFDRIFDYMDNKKLAKSLLAKVKPAEEVSLVETRTIDKELKYGNYKRRASTMNPPPKAKQKIESVYEIQTEVPRADVWQGLPESIVHPKSILEGIQTARLKVPMVEFTRGKTVTRLDNVVQTKPAIKTKSETLTKNLVKNLSKTATKMNVLSKSLTETKYLTEAKSKTETKSLTRSKTLTETLAKSLTETKTLTKAITLTLSKAKTASINKVIIVSPFIPSKPLLSFKTYYGKLKPFKSKKIKRATRYQPSLYGVVSGQRKIATNFLSGLEIRGY